MSVQTVEIAEFQSVYTDSAFLQTIVESLVDGVLLVTVKGDWVYGNYNAYRICQQINSHKSASDRVPNVIRQICQTYLNNHSKLNPASQLESETVFNETHYRVRVRWFQRDKTNTPLLLVTLEDCDQAARNRAIAEAQQFNLTERQTDVWLLYRMGYSYREIATQLFVTVNTVKRHMKDIYAKQRLNNSCEY